MALTDYLLTGYNHNIPYRGEMYHVQTEFAGDAPRVDTVVFLEGRILDSERTQVDLDSKNDPDQYVLALMKNQQRNMIRRLVGGHLGKDDTETLDDSHPVEAAGTQLELRRTLVRLIRSVRPHETPEGVGPLTDRLRSSVTSVAVLTGKNLERAIRKEELAELLILRSEAIEWLKHGEGRSAERGRKVWEGLAELARSFASINRRKDLVEHDRKALERVLDRISGLDDQAQVGREVIGALASVRGRSGSLDHFTDGLDESTVGRLRELVERVLERLESILPSSSSRRRIA